MPVELNIDNATRRRLLRISALQGREFSAFLAKTMAKAEPGIVREVGISARENLRVRSGNLVKAISAQSEINRGVPGLRVGVLRGPALRYAGIQEFGTKDQNPDSPFDVIRPRKAKALAIPVDGGPAVNASGVPRYASPRDYPRPLTTIPFKRSRQAVGRLVEERALQRERKRAQSQDREVNYANVPTVYLLTKKVSIKPKRYIQKGVDKFLPKLVNSLARDAEKLFGGDA